jgi:adenine deaminase
VAVGSDPRACGGPLIERESALGIARAQALRMYTLNSAWLVRDDDKRGSIEAGKVADLAVLDADLMRVPVDQIGKIRSVLTIMDGRTVHAETPYAHHGLDDRKISRRCRSECRAQSWSARWCATGETEVR